MSAFFSHKNKKANLVKYLYNKLYIYFLSVWSVFLFMKHLFPCLLRTPITFYYLHLANIEQTVISFFIVFTFDLSGGDLRSTHTLPHACAKAGVPPGSGSANPLQHPGG